MSTPPQWETTVRERLREVRLDRGLSQETLGRKVRMAHTVISQFETGARSPGPHAHGLLSQGHAPDHRRVRQPILTMMPGLNLRAVGHGRLGARTVTKRMPRPTLIPSRIQNGPITATDVRWFALPAVS